MTDSFGARLRRERERRTIDIAEVAARTKIKASLFEALERNDVSHWPAGLFRRSFIRAYAEAVGLDPKATLAEFMLNFPDPADPAAEQPADRSMPPAKPVGKLPAKPWMKPPSGVIARAAAPILETIVGSSTRLPASESAPGLAIVHDSETAASSPDPVGAGPIELVASMRLTLADGDQPFQRGEVLADPRARWTAAACDLAVVVAAALLLFLIAGRFWMPLGLAALGYYIGGILLLGNSPGVYLLAPRQPVSGERPTEPARALRPRHAEASRSRPAPALPRNPFRAAPRRARTTRT